MITVGDIIPFGAIYFNYDDCLAPSPPNEITPDDHVVKNGKFERVYKMIMLRENSIYIYGLAVSNQVVKYCTTRQTLNFIYDVQNCGPRISFL